MSHGLPVDLSPRPQDLQACRWSVVWWVDGHRCETPFADRPLAEAYAAKHHGRIVRLAALGPWPARPS